MPAIRAFHQLRTDRHLRAVQALERTSTVIGAPAQRVRPEPGDDRLDAPGILQHLAGDGAAEVRPADRQIRFGGLQAAYDEHWQILALSL